MKRIYTQLLSAACLVSTQAIAQVPFAPIDTNFTTTTVIIPPSPLKYDTLFIGNYHYVYIDGGADSALAKQNHDFTGLVPVGGGNKNTWVIVNHEITNTKK